MPEDAPVAPPYALPIDTDRVAAVLEEHLEPLARIVSELRGNAAKLVAFLPPGVNPVVLARERVEGLHNSAEELLELLTNADARSTTADVGPALFDRGDHHLQIRIDRTAFSLRRALQDVAQERAAQDAEHGGPDHDDTHTVGDWLELIGQHLLRAAQPAAPADDLEDHRRQLIRVAGLAVAAVESLDRAEARA